MSNEFVEMFQSVEDIEFSESSEYEVSQAFDELGPVIYTEVDPELGF